MLIRIWYISRFLWVATRGYRLRPWRSPYLCWRIETYWGYPAAEVGVVRFWSFAWERRKALAKFLYWVATMAASADASQKGRRLHS
ncbi:MAG: hypothetical protein CMN58_08330 [Solibacterales bacterium]|nr:hypothetical protein [Bryobacterales bacterium]